MAISADEVLAVRKRMAKTQEQMAALCGVNIRTWRRWETDGASELVGRFLLKLEQA